MIRLVLERIDVAGLRSVVAHPEDGAVIAFEGTVRNHSRGKKVTHLEYHAYETMAQRKLEEICRRAKAEFAIREIGIIHRLGRLYPGECSVAIVVAAAHRAPAFDACRFAIETLKKIVPIWKKEFFEDGEVWIEGES